jgi:hypothetical protein
MYFKFNHFSLDQNKICQNEIEKNPHIYNSTTEYNLGEKKILKPVRRLKHEHLIKSEQLIDTILSDKLIDYLLVKFEKIYLIPVFFAAFDGFNPTPHRDGQNMKYSKQSLLDCSKIFKVAHYLKFIESEPVIYFQKFSSAPIKLFSNPFLFKYSNYFIENCIKKNFMKKIDYNYGDALIFDQNIWHSAHVPNNANLTEKINKILVDYEFSTCLDSLKRHIDANHHNRPPSEKISLNMFCKGTKLRLLKKMNSNKNFNVFF